MTFFNTNLTKEPELSIRENKALSQEDFIKNIFQKENKPLTASEVYYICIANNKYWPLTSVRRAISVLKDKTSLKKLDKTKKGVYNANERYFQLIN